MILTKGLAFGIYFLWDIIPTTVQSKRSLPGLKVSQQWLWGCKPYQGMNEMWSGVTRPKLTISTLGTVALVGMLIVSFTLPLVRGYTYQGYDVAPGEEAQAFAMTQPQTSHCSPPPTDPNDTTPPHCTFSYLPNFVFSPGGVSLGGYGILRARGQYKLFVYLVNTGPVATNHTFTLAYPDGSPLYTVWLNRTGTENVTAGLHLVFTNDTVTIDGGPPIRTNLTDPTDPLPPALRINFYCLHHRTQGMVGYLVLDSFQGYGGTLGLTRPKTAIGLGTILGAVVIFGLTVAVVLWRRK